MKILIFGGSGLIGKHIISAMSNGVHEIVGFTRNPGRVDPGFRQKARWIKWDGQSIEPVIRFCTGKYAIVNLVGENIGGKLWTKNQKEKILTSQKIFPDRLIEEGFEFDFKDVRTAMYDLLMKKN
jgi:NAD dependent epimerase/dehydratase family enzyme